MIQFLISLLLLSSAFSAPSYMRGPLITSNENMHQRFPTSYIPGHLEHEPEPKPYNIIQSHPQEYQQAQEQATHLTDLLQEISKLQHEKQVQENIENEQFPNANDQHMYQPQHFQQNINDDEFSQQTQEVEKGPSGKLELGFGDQQQHDIDDDIELSQQTQELYGDQHLQQNINDDEFSQQTQEVEKGPSGKLELGFGDQQHDIDDDIELSQQTQELYGDQHLQQNINDDEFFQQTQEVEKGPSGKLELGFGDQQQHDIDDNIELSQQTQELYGDQHLQQNINDDEFSQQTQEIEKGPSGKLELGFGDQQQHDIDDDIALSQQTQQLYKENINKLEFGNEDQQFQQNINDDFSQQTQQGYENQLLQESIGLTNDHSQETQQQTNGFDSQYQLNKVSENEYGKPQHQYEELDKLEIEHDGKQDKIPETTNEPGFWKNLGSKISNSYNTAKEKAKSLAGKLG